MGDVSGVLQIAVVVFLFFATKTLPTLWHGNHSMQKWQCFPNCFRAFLEVMEFEIVSKTIVQRKNTKQLN